MSFRKIAVPLGLLVLALVGASPAPAVNAYLHGGNMFGNVLASGTTVSSSTLNGTSLMVTSAGNISCSTGAASATVGSSGGTSITGTLDSFSLGSSTTHCTDSLPFIDVWYCTRYASAPASITVSGSVATPSAGTTSPASTLGITGDTTVVMDCRLSLGDDCFFSGQLVDGVPMTTFNTSTNDITANSLKYTNVPVSKYTTGVTNNVACPTSGSFSVEFINVRDSLGRLVDANNNP